MKKHVNLQSKQARYDSRICGQNYEFQRGARRSHDDAAYGQTIGCAQFPSPSTNIFEKMFFVSKFVKLINCFINLNWISSIIFQHVVQHHFQICLQEKWIANRQIELRHEVNKNMTSIEEVLAMAKNTDDLGSDDEH